MTFTDKVVLITGASSGIGACTSVHFAKLNAKLALVGRNNDRLEDVAQKCIDSSGKKPLTIIADININTKDIIDKTIAHYGRLDVLVNVAGIGAPSSILRMNLENFDKVMNTNVRSVYHLTALAVPHLIESKGNVVNVSSVAGIRSFPYFLAYCVSKAALDQFTKCISLELGPKGVRVNSVNPGVIITNFHSNMGVNADAYQNYLEECKTSHALGRVGQVDEVAEGIVFLASDAARFITGTLLSIDGGKSNMCPR